MSLSYTTTELLSSIKKRAFIPTSQSTFQDTDILRLANEELQLEIVPMLMRVRENYFVQKQDVAVVGGQANYPLPIRAIGSKLSDVQFLDTSTNLKSLSKLHFSEVPGLNGPSFLGTPQYFYLQSGDIYTVPTPNAAIGTLRLYFFQRPNNLVTLSSVSTISSISTNSVTVNNVPSDYDTSGTYDIIKNQPDFRSYGIDLTIVSIVGTTITFTDSLPTGISVGDFVCLAGEAPVPQVPVELHPILAQRTSIKMLEAMGDKENMQLSEAKLKTMQDSALSLFTNRIENEDQKISSNNSLMNWVTSRF